MIKHILVWIASAGMMFLGVSCAKDQEKECQEITDAISRQDFEKVTNLCDNLYDRLPECSVKTLGDLTLSYITLAFVGATTGDQSATEQSMRRAVDCYDAAMDKNAKRLDRLQPCGGCSWIDRAAASQQRICDSL